MSREEAARYIGAGTTLFDEMVADGRMPKPKRVNSRTIWDRFALDTAFTYLEEGGQNRIDQLQRQATRKQPVNWYAEIDKQFEKSRPKRTRRNARGSVSD